MSDDIEPRNFHLLIEILQKETEGIHFDPTVVQARLAVVMNSVGIFVPTDDMSDKEIEYSKIFFEQSNNPAYTPREKVQHYKKILESSDPLGEGLIHSIFRAEINARARSRTARGLKNPYVKSYLSNDRLPNLIDRLSHDLALLREVAEALKIYNERLVRRGAPYKQPQRTLLISLANIFVELTNKKIDSFDLPHAKGSRFIKFCHLALEPHFERTEAGTAALSKAWKRLKTAEKDGR